MSGQQLGVAAAAGSRPSIGTWWVRPPRCHRDVAHYAVLSPFLTHFYRTRQTHSLFNNTSRRRSVGRSAPSRTFAAAALFAMNGDNSRRPTDRSLEADSALSPCTYMLSSGGGGCYQPEASSGTHAAPPPAAHIHSPPPPPRKVTAICLQVAPRAPSLTRSLSLSAEYIQELPGFFTPCGM